MIISARLFSSDQLSLAMAVYLDNPPVELFPDTCNHRGPWKVSDDGAQLVEFHAPYSPLGIVHLTGHLNHRADPPIAIEVPRVSGGSITTTIRESDWEARLPGTGQMLTKSPA